MITGIFILADGYFYCSNKADINIKADKQNVKRDNIITASECYFSLDKLQVNQIVECVLKFETAAPVNFTGCIKSINGKKDIVISVINRFETTGVNQILSTIASLM